MEYLARGTIADAKKLSEEETDWWTDRRAAGEPAEAVYQWDSTGWDSANNYAAYHPYDMILKENGAGGTTEE